MTEAWGEPLGNVFNYDEKLLIPGLAMVMLLLRFSLHVVLEKNAVKFIMIL